MLVSKIRSDRQLSIHEVNTLRVGLQVARKVLHGYQLYIERLETIHMVHLVFFTVYCFGT
jgi:hypothetical protein